MVKTTLDQRRAANALAQVRGLHDSGRNYGHYVSYVKSLPASILQNGLGSALATLLAAAKGNDSDPHRLLYDHVNQWICADTEDAVYPDDADTLEAIVRHEERKYLHAQAESLAYLDWLKKFAVANLTASEGS